MNNIKIEDMNGSIEDKSNAKIRSLSQLTKTVSPVKKKEN